MPAACRMFSAGAHVIERTANTNQLDVLHLKGICSTTDGPSGSGWRRRRRRALQMAERRTEFAARAPEIEKGGSTAREVASPRLAAAAAPLCAVVRVSTRVPMPMLPHATCARLVASQRLAGRYLKLRCNRSGCECALWLGVRLRLRLGLGLLRSESESIRIRI